MQQVFMEPEQVFTSVATKGSKISTVVFVKNDGTVRIINGLFKPANHIVGSERGVMQGEAMKSRGQVPIYDLKEKKWKSFFAAKVLEVK